MGSSFYHILYSAEKMNPSKLRVISVTGFPRVTYTWLFLGRQCLIYGDPWLSQCQKRTLPLWDHSAPHLILMSTAKTTMCFTGKCAFKTVQIQIFFFCHHQLLVIQQPPCASQKGIIKLEEHSKIMVGSLQSE